MTARNLPRLGENGVAEDSGGGNIAAGVALHARLEQLIGLTNQLLIYHAVDMDFETPK